MRTSEELNRAEKDERLQREAKGNASTLDGRALLFVEVGAENLQCEARVRNVCFCFACVCIVPSWDWMVHVFVTTAVTALRTQLCTL